MWKMNPWLCLAGLLVLLAGCRPSPDRLAGVWTGLAYSPGGEVVDLSYTVTPVADSFQVTLEMAQGNLPVHTFQIEEGQLTFTMSPGFKMECRLLRETNGLYKGGCIDGERYVGPIVLAPPDKTAGLEDMDVDKAFDIWGIVRADYEWERYGHSRAEKANLEELFDAAPSGRQVEVDGKQFHLVEQGEGDVTVVLEGGLGDDHSIWRSVQEALAEETRVMAYDRAGLGRSDASEAARTPAQIADELHAVLQRAGASPPYVLVGHEVGGLYVRAFAARYPEEVGGLVLIDPAHEQLGARWRALDADSWASYLQKKQAFYRNLPGAIADEFEAYAALLQAGQFPEAAAPPGVPTVVITGARPAEAPTWVGETPEGVQARQAVHAAWANQIELGTHLVAENAGSYVHYEQPDLFIDALRQVLEAVREREEQ